MINLAFILRVFSFPPVYLGEFFCPIHNRKSLNVHYTVVFTNEMGYFHNRFSKPHDMENTCKSEKNIILISLIHLLRWTGKPTYKIFVSETSDE